MENDLGKTVAERERERGNGRREGTPGTCISGISIPIARPNEKLLANARCSMRWGNVGLIWEGLGFSVLSVGMSNVVLLYTQLR